jgi:hypothetical protein
MRLALRRGLPTKPNVLLTIPGRVTGRPHSTPVALWELGNRWFVQASFGEVNWVWNLRASREAAISRCSWLQAVRATELAPADAVRSRHR